MNLLETGKIYFWRPAYRAANKIKIKLKVFQVPITKLLCGGENGIRAASYAVLTNNFLLPSTPINENSRTKLLQLYNKIGDEVLSKEIFETTDYYKNAYQCMKLTGSYFYDRPEKIKEVAASFIHQYKGEKGIGANFPLHPGQSEINQPIWIRPIKYSSCYEVIDGNHRIALSIMQGKQTVPAIIYDKESALTPLQQLLLDCLWINKKKWLYQPVCSPEIQDEWILVRNSFDRLKMMNDFLRKHNLEANSRDYIDIGSSYGWFVNEFSQMGFNSFGMDRDPFGMEVGFKVYGLDRTQIIHNEIGAGLEELVYKKKSFNIVSCLSVLHHFVLGKSSTSAENFIKLIDKITKEVLFIDTGEEHEKAFGEALNGWSPEFIKQWILKHSSFKKVISLGIDNDCKYPFEGYYSRTLFACVR